jgi:hypothetical protein
MRRKYAPAPPMGPFFEDEEQVISKVCIRIFDRVMEGVNAVLEAGGELDVRDIYMDVLADELKPYGFSLAYELYSKDPVVTRNRIESALEEEEREQERLGLKKKKATR